jgi:hypothetical protein
VCVRPQEFLKSLAYFRETLYEHMPLEDNFSCIIFGFYLTLYATKMALKLREVGCVIRKHRSEHSQLLLLLLLCYAVKDHEDDVSL